MADLVQVQVQENVGTIDDNLNAVEESIREKVAEYSMVVVTEDSIADSKKFLAGIRKEKKSLESDLKEIKKRWMAPYDAFAKRAKEIIALYDEPEGIINGQLEAYEEQRKELRRQEIEYIYEHCEDGYRDWLPLDRIYNPKWENKGTTGKQIREDMEMLFGQLKVSISTIKSLNSEFEADALAVLKDGGTLAAAMAEISELQRQKARFEEQARREAEEKLRREAEQARLEAERREAEERRKAEQARIEAERIEAEERQKAEQARLEAERREAEELQEAEQKAVEAEQERSEAEWEEDKPGVERMMEMPFGAAQEGQVLHAAEELPFATEEETLPFPIAEDGTIPQEGLPFPLEQDGTLPADEEMVFTVSVTVTERELFELEKYLVSENLKYEVM